MLKKIIQLLPKKQEKICDPLTKYADRYDFSPQVVMRRRSENRIYVGAYIFLAVYSILALKTLHIASDSQPSKAYEALSNANYLRGEIYDRNGQIIATHLKVANFIINPSEIIDPAEAYENIVYVLPNINKTRLKKILLDPKKRYAVIKRDITPREQQELHDLGLPGIFFETSDLRYYPQNELTAHVVGLTDTDQNGVAGIERKFDTVLKGQAENTKPDLTLSLDLRVQEILHKRLQQAVDDFSAVGAAGVVMSAKTGEIIGMVSLPDFNPNKKITTTSEAMFNRATVGSYEMGSTFKIINSAIAFDTHSVKLSDKFDVSKDVYIGRYSIGDFHRINDKIDAGEILQKSSNIGSVHMADRFGPHLQQYYMKRLGLLDRSPIELPENGRPLLPSAWARIQMMTISFGHGLAVTPLQMVTSVASIVNGGYAVKPTLIKRTDPIIYQETQTYPSFLDGIKRLWQTGDYKNYFKQAPKMMPEVTPAEVGERVVSDEVSKKLRYIMRLVCEPGGTGKSADVVGYPVIGKTGTAEKKVEGGRGYNKKSLISSFIGAFPATDPEYVVYVMVDEPKPNLKISPFATGGVVGAPVVGDVVRQIAPLLNVKPVPPGETPDSISKRIYNRDAEL